MSKGERDMKTIGQTYREEAERRGIPAQSLTQVKQTIEQCRRQKSDANMARLLLRHGRITENARNWLEREYPAE